MAAIDSLLRLVISQKADALRIRPGAAPALLLGEVERPLSMPPLPAEIVDRFLEELAPGAASLDQEGVLECNHVTAGGEAFRVRAELRQGRVVRATFRPGMPSGAPWASAKADPGVEPIATTGVEGLVGEERAHARAFSSPKVLAPAPPPAQALAPAPAPAQSHTPPPALAQLLNDAVEQGASDLFLSTGRPARWRIQGVLSTVQEVVPMEGDLEALLAGHLQEVARVRLAQHGSVDLAFGLPPVSRSEIPARFRVSLFREEGGLAAAIRPIRPRAPGLEELGLPPAVERLAEHRHGLVLMVGPTGSGKSTTLAGLIEQLNRTVARHVITIEDPIELRYVPRRCLIHQREVGTHVSSFADGIRSALRSSPDVILVGEMRDPETIAAALTAAETGHLVLSTLHCGTAGMAVDRIVDAFPQARQNQVRLQLGDVLRSVVSQRLLPAVGGGRVPALEILQVTRAVAALIRDGRSHQIASLIQTGRDAGMVPLDRALADLVRAGRISLAVAMEAAEAPADLQALLAR